MRQQSLRVVLPLLFVAALLGLAGASLTLALHQRQHELTEESRVNLLGDVARLARLADQGWPAEVSLISTDLAQIASRPQVVAAVLFSEGGDVLLAHRMAWRGRAVQDVLPDLELARVAKVARGRMPDWRLSPDGNRLDALQSFDLPSADHEVRRSRRGLAYVVYDLKTSRQIARYDEVVERLPDILGLLLLLGPLVWWVSRYVTHPLGRLDQAATALRRGQWHADIPRGGFAEIDRLSTAFESLRQDLAATWRAMPDLMFEMDAQGTYLRVVASRAELLAHGTADDLVGKRLDEVMPPATAQLVLHALKEAGETGGVWGRELSLDVPAGQRWFEISVAKKMGVDGAAPTFLVLSRDVTERKQAQGRLVQLNDELEQRVLARTSELLAAKNEAERANQSKTEFLSRMSHELRTPLNAILGFGQLLELSLRDKLQQDHARQIIHGGKHLLALINEVLDLARVESGQMSVSLERVGVFDLVQECLDLVRPQAEARHVTLHASTCEPRLQVMADRIRLKQVLLNLLSNAIKFNRSGGEVRVSCVLEDHALLVHVTDTGPGLDADQQGRLFVPFERLGADVQQIEGTGIGLALSKRLMALMGGAIGVTSQPGLGSTFWVRLVRAADDVLRGAVDAIQAPAASLTPSSAAVQATRTVLCIEDNPNNLQLIDSVLGMLPDVRLISAMAPGLGLDLARTHQPDLILLDINLPDMDGYAVMQCLREHPLTQSIPVVAVSANAMPKDLERGRAAGFADYVTKPIDVGRLLRVVDQLTSRGRPARPLDWSI